MSDALTAQRRGSFTVDEWRQHRRISRAQAYKLWAQNRGPKFYCIGSRRYISTESDAAWLADREAEATV
jgi:hypothetical protein